MLLTIGIVATGLTFVLHKAVVLKNKRRIANETAIKVNGSGKVEKEEGAHVGNVVSELVEQ